MGITIVPSLLLDSKPKPIPFVHTFSCALRNTLGQTSVHKLPISLKGPPFLYMAHVTHCGEAVSNPPMPTNLLGPLITSKTRLKLLLRFFVNQDLSGYLQGLSKELEENSNSVRVELNRLEQAGMLQSEMEGRRKLYRVNKKHPLTSDLTTMLRKVTGIDAIIERVVKRVKENLDQVWICGKLAQGLESDVIEVVLVGSDVDEEYIAELMGKVAKVTEKQINYDVLPIMPQEKRSECLLIWEKQGEQ